MKAMKAQGLKRSGYTLAEMMITVSIAGLLLSMALYGGLAYRKRSDCQTCRGNIQMLHNAISEYALDFQMKVGSTVTIAQVTPRYFKNAGVLTCPGTANLTYGPNLIVGTAPVCPGKVAGHTWSPTEAPGL